MIAAESDDTGGLIQSMFLTRIYRLFESVCMVLLIEELYTNLNILIKLLFISGNVFMLQTVAGGAINKVAANADDSDAVQYSANAAITGYSIRFQQSPCIGPTQS